MLSVPRPLWVALAVAYAWVAGGLRPFTVPAAISTALGGMAVLAVAWRTARPAPVVPVVPVGRRLAAAWVGWLAAVTGWELWALFSRPRASHPTISSLLDPLIDTHPARSVAVLAWLALGCWLARR